MLNNVRSLFVLILFWTQNFPVLNVSSLKWTADPFSTNSPMVFILYFRFSEYFPVIAAPLLVYFQKLQAMCFNVVVGGRELFFSFFFWLFSYALFIPSRNSWTVSFFFRFQILQMLIIYHIYQYFNNNFIINNNVIKIYYICITQIIYIIIINTKRILYIHETVSCLCFPTSLHSIVI